MFTPISGLSLVRALKGQEEEEQESMCPGAEWTKVLAEPAWSPGPTPADDRRFLSPGMGACILVGHCVRTQFI